MSVEYGLDLGGSQFNMAAYDFKNKKIKILSVDACGFRGVKSSSLEEAEIHLKKLVDYAKKDFDSTPKKISLNVTNSFINCKHVSSSLCLPQRRHVTENDLMRLEEKALQSIDQVALVQLVPQCFLIDGRFQNYHPIGMLAENLEVTYCIVFSDQAALRSLVHLCNACGMRVQNLSFNGLSSSYVTLPKDKKEQGVMLLDMGAESTDGVVIVDGIVKKLFSISMGGYSLTRDLAHGLQMTFIDAEQMKLKLRDSLGVMTSHYDQKTFILKCRLKEMGDAIKKEVCEFLPNLRAGCVLTGGGSLLDGMDLNVSRMLGLKVTRATDIDLVHFSRHAFHVQTVSPRYASLYGLGVLLKEQKALKSAHPMAAQTLKWCMRMVSSCDLKG